MQKCGPFRSPVPDASTAQDCEFVSKTLNRASMIAVAATLITIVVSADGSGAAAQDSISQPAKTEIVTHFTAEPIVQPLPAERQEVLTEDSQDQTQVPAAPVSASSLASLVAAQAQPGDLPRELNCLAGAIYFEAKSESLPGQLAVGRVVIARSKSGRFPNSYCGVVFQPSQFSFVRGQSMPAIDKHGRQWRNAVAIAQIAHDNSWHSPVEGALYFHAARVSPGWRLHRIAQVDNHVFYR